MILVRDNWILYCSSKTFKGLCTKSGSWFLLSNIKRNKAERLVYLICHSGFDAAAMFQLTWGMGIPLACLLKWVGEIRGPCEEARLCMGWVGSLRSLGTIAVTTIERRAAVLQTNEGMSKAVGWAQRRRQHLAPPCVSESGLRTPWNMSGNTVNTQDKTRTPPSRSFQGRERPLRQSRDETWSRALLMSWFRSQMRFSHVLCKAITWDFSLSLSWLQGDWFAFCEEGSQSTVMPPFQSKCLPRSLMTALWVMSFLHVWVPSIFSASSSP